MSQQMNAVDRISEFLTSRKAIPLRIVLLLLWLAALAFGGIAQGKIGTVAQNDQAVFLPKSAESTLASDAAQPFQDSSTIPALLVAERTDGEALTKDDLAQLKSITDALPEQQIPGDLSFSDLLAGKTAVVPSEDGTAALIPASLDSQLINELDANGDK